MHFSLHSLSQQHENTQSYFRLHADRTELLSPFYANPTTALEAIKQLLYRLRSGDVEDFMVIDKQSQFTLRLFNEQEPAVGRTPVFPKELAARGTVELWMKAAQATTFPVQFWELDEEIPGLTSLKDLDLGETDQNYQWLETDATLLRLGKSTLMGFLPKAGLQANLLRKPCESIFNALQPSLSTDFPLFLGRKNEVKEVYELLQENNLLLLYGEARVGKTSLLQCGLANRIEKDGDRIIVVRRSDRPILATFADLIRNATESTDDDAGDNATPLALALRLEQESTQKIYFIFDQLEQLFVSDKAEEERASFFKLIRELTEIEDVNFRIVLSLRETMLAPFADYEKELPTLLDNRYRLLPVKESVMRKASVNLLELLQMNNLLSVDKPEGVSQKICKKLANDKGDVPVHCMQIYLHQLQQKSCQETEPGNPVPFNEELVDKMGSPAPLINEYMSQHIADLKTRQKETNDLIEHAVLQREIEELESSRLQCGCEENTQQAVAAVAAAPVPVIPWWIVAPLVALPLLLFSFWWFNDVPPLPTACELAEADDSCLAYVNYLCTYGDTTSCSERFEAILRKRDCDIWWDYEQTIGTNSCERYEQFYEKYLEQDVCMDRVRARLLELKCPIIRDTFERRDTTLQTKVIYREKPSQYQTAPVIGNDYKREGDYLLKPVGPVFITTDPVRGGPYVWGKALNACTANGFRLPCIGEIEYLLEKIYSGDNQKAYHMLAGTGETYLVNPNEINGGSLKFWTATEADDNTAWTYSFNPGTQTIDYQHDTNKSTALPCLCFEDRPEVKGSSKPPCYQKSIRIPDQN